MTEQGDIGQFTKYKPTKISPHTAGVASLNKSRSILPLFAGWLSLIFAAILLAFSVFLFVLQAPPLQYIVIGSCALFPAMIAVACLMPSRRTIALRLIGAVVCVACVAIFIVSLVSPRGDDQGRPRRGLLVVAAIAGGAMAIKGKWPGGEEKGETARKNAN